MFGSQIGMGVMAISFGIRLPNRILRYDKLEYGITLENVGHYRISAVSSD